MIEVLSGAIVNGIHYVVSNTTDGTGTIIYDSIVYTHGKSFFGQYGIANYTASTPDIKVYEDDTELTVLGAVTAEVETEVSPYPEVLTYISSVTAENFNDNEEVVFPETLKYLCTLTVDGTPINRNQVIKQRRVW